MGFESRKSIESTTGEELTTEEKKSEWDKLRNDPEIIEFYKQFITEDQSKIIREFADNELSEISHDLREKLQRVKNLEKEFDVGFFPEGEEFIIRSGM